MKDAQQTKKKLLKKIYINSFCLKCHKSYFSLAPTNEQMVKEWNKIKVV